MDLKYNNQNAVEVQTVIFNSKGWTKILYETFRNYNNFHPQSPYFRVSNVMGQINTIINIMFIFLYFVKYPLQVMTD